VTATRRIVTASLDDRLLEAELRDAQLQSLLQREKALQRHVQPVDMSANPFIAPPARANLGTDVQKGSQPTSKATVKAPDLAARPRSAQPQGAHPRQPSGEPRASSGSTSKPRRVSQPPGWITLSPAETRALDHLLAHPTVAAILAEQA
jgi:hypothetical protein